MHRNKKYFSLLILVLLLSSCIDFTPDFVDSQTISFDENSQNSGIINFYGEEGYIVTSNFIDRYNNMMNIEIYDNINDKKIKLKEFFVPPLKKNFGVKKLENTNYYIINNQGMQNFLLMNNIRKMYFITY